MTDEELTQLRKIPIQQMNKKVVIPTLLAHIDEQVGQIATLKAALIDRDLRLLEECNGECGKNNILPEDCDQCEHEYVIHQLAQEYPKIFQEGQE